MDAAAPIWQKAAEFGVVAFLFCIVLLGVGFGLWKIGNRVADAVTEMIKTTNATSLRTADATDRIGDAVEKIGTMMTISEQSISDLKKYSSRHTRAERIMLDVLSEVIPQEKTKLVQLLESARRQLDD